MQLLDSLLQKYSQDLTEDEINVRFTDIFNNYIAIRESNLLDLISSTTVVTMELVQNHSDPLIEKAFHLQYPNLDIDNLTEYSHDGLLGITSGVKGKYFELLVQDKLNSGQQIGDIILSPDLHVELASSPTQAVWDLEILDSHNHIVDYLQAKATSSLSYIKGALVNYPDIKVVTTSDLTSHLSDAYYNVDISEISNDSIKDQVSHSIGLLSDNLGEKFLENFNPLIPIAIITLHEGKKYFAGETTLNQALSGIRKRGSVTSFVVAIGAFFQAIDLGIVSIPATLLTRLQFIKYDNHKLLDNLIEKQNSFICYLTTKY